MRRILLAVVFFATVLLPSRLSLSSFNNPTNNPARQSTLSAPKIDSSLVTHKIRIPIVAKEGLFIPAPTNLTGEPNGTTVALTWQDNSNNETEFRIEFSAYCKPPTWTEIKRLPFNSTSSIASALQPASLVCFRVRAYAAGNYSGYSNSVYVFIPDAVPRPAPPDQLVASTPLTGSEKVVLNWHDNSSNETGFEVFSSLDGGAFVFEGTMPANTTSAEDTNLLPSRYYCFKVYAINAGGSSASSNISCAWTLSNGVPPTVNGLNARLASNTTILLTWTNNAYYDGYDIYESVDGGAFIFEYILTGMYPGASTPPLSAGHRYRYKIQPFVVISSTRYNGAFSGISNEVLVPGTAEPTVTRFMNDAAYPLISLVIGSTEYFPASPQGIPPGSGLQVALAPGSYIYSAKTGFWDGSERFILYTYNGSFTQQNGVAGTINISNPTIAQLLTHFSSNMYYVGEYWSGTIINSKGFCFRSNGTYQNYINSAYAGSGTYSLVSYPGSYTVTFHTSGFAANGFYDELGGYFDMQNGPADWPAIRYDYDGLCP